MISPVAIGVAAGLGTLIVSIAIIRLYLWYKRRVPSNPLPPVQMLAHERMYQEELYLPQADYAGHLQSLSPTTDKPGPYSHDSSVGTAYPSPPSCGLSDDMRDEEDKSKSRSSSRQELVNPESQFERPLSRATSSQHLSTRSLSFTSIPSHRGPPHKRLDRFDIVLPAPLANEQNALSKNGGRISVYDQWTPPLARSSSNVRFSHEKESTSSVGDSQEKLPTTESTMASQTEARSHQ